MFSLHVSYSRHTLGHTCTVWQAYCVYSVKCMFTSVSGNVGDCSEFLSGTYIDKIVLYLHNN